MVSIVILIRGEDPARSEVVDRVMSALNTGVNDVRADLVSIRDCTGVEDKADSKTCKNLFKRLIGGIRPVVVVDHPLKSRNEWMSYIEIVKSIKDSTVGVIGIDVVSDDASFKKDLGGLAVSVNGPDDPELTSIIAKI